MCSWSLETAAHEVGMLELIAQLLLEQIDYVY